MISARLVFTLFMFLYGAALGWAGAQMIHALAHHDRLIAALSAVAGAALCAIIYLHLTKFPRNGAIRWTKP